MPGFASRSRSRLRCCLTRSVLATPVAPRQAWLRHRPRFGPGCASGTGCKHAPRSRSGVGAARWISRHQTGICTFKFALYCIRSMLVLSSLFVLYQTRLTWKWLPWGAAECLNDSAPLLRRRRCALSWCGRGRHCSGLRRSLSAAGLVLRCLCSLASHCAGSAGRRVWTAIWMFALKSCQLGLSAARDASVLAAILRRASLTASALAAPAAQHWSWLRQWPELSAHCVSALCPVLLRVRVRVALPRIGPACASGPALVLAAPVAPVVNRRSFTAELRRHAVIRRSFTCR